MLELYTIQQELKCKKDKFNAFGKYYYRSAESILESVKPLLKTNNCVLLMSDDIIQLGDRFYVKATATIMNNKDGKSLSVSAMAREPLIKKGASDEQVTGSASSYARKYALNGLFAIDDTTDTDSQDNTQVTAIQTINKLIKEKQVNTVDFLSYFKVKAVSELSFDNQQKAIQMLEKK